MHAAGVLLPLQDGVVLGAALRDATVAADVGGADMPAAAIARALRGFERRRSTRCAPLIAKARGNIRAFRAPTSSWVGLLTCTQSTLPAYCACMHACVMAMPGGAHHW